MLGETQNQFSLTSVASSTWRRPKSNFSSIKLAALSFSDASAYAVQQFAEAARRKHLVLDRSLPKENSAVLADVSALGQVLDNLLSNALKFSPLGGRIRVSVRPGEKQVECRIQDHGPGFTAEDRVRMFRRAASQPGPPTTNLPAVWD